MLLFWRVDMLLFLIVEVKFELLTSCERFNFLYSYSLGDRLFRSSMLKFLLLFSVLSSEISCGGVKIEAAVSSLSSSSI